MKSNSRTGHLELQIRDQVMKAGRIDESRRAVFATMSTGAVDLYNEIIDPKAFEEYLPKFAENAVLLADHDHTKQIGHWEDVQVTREGLVGWAVFARTPLGEERWQLYRDGHAKAFSVGFIVLDSEQRIAKVQGKDTKVRAFTKVRLLECSCVSVPANPDALVIAASLNSRGGEATPPPAQAFTDEQLKQLRGLVREQIDELNDQMPRALADAFELMAGREVHGSILRKVGGATSGAEEELAEMDRQLREVNALFRA